MWVELLRYVSGPVGGILARFTRFFAGPGLFIAIALGLVGAYGHARWQVHKIDRLETTVQVEVRRRTQAEAIRDQATRTLDAVSEHQKTTQERHETFREQREQVQTVAPDVLDQRLPDSVIELLRPHP